jgi:hypothetical protein
MTHRKQGTKQAAQQIRRADVVAGLEAGKTGAQMAEELEVHRNTISRDLKDLREQFSAGNSEAFAEARAKQVRVFELMEAALVEGKIDAQTATAWKGIRSEISALLGVNAPSKSITARIGADSSPVFLRFKSATAGLDDAQLEDAFAQLAKIPRTPKKPAMDASWFPAPEAKLLASEHDGGNEHDE